MRLMRQHHQPRLATIALNGLVHALGLNRESAHVVVLLAVDQEQGLVDLVGRQEGRQLEVALRCFPDVAALALEAKGREGAVVRTTACDTRAEQIAMRQEIGRHERPVAVAAHSYAITIGNTTLHGEVDGGLQTVSLKMPAIITTDLRLNEPRYASLPNIMKAKSKPLAQKTPADYGVDVSPRLKTLKVVEPPVRSAGIKVADVDALVAKLKEMGVAA